MEIKKNVGLIIVAMILALVITIPTLSATETQFDNSEFVSQLTSEQQQEIELQEAQSDLATYNETIEARGEFKNFAEFNYFLTDEEYQTGLQTTYDQMAENTDYSEEQKNAYYNAYIGTQEAPGLMRQMQDLNLKLMEYRDNQSVIVDCTAALALLDEYGTPKINVNNLEFIAQTSQLLNEVESSLVTIDRSTLDQQEENKLQDTNVLFTTRLNALFKQIPYLAMPKLDLFARLMHKEVIMNIGLLIGIILLFVVRFPVVRKQQEYAWGKFKPLSLIAIVAVAGFFFIFFTWFFSMPYKIENPGYSIYVDGKSSTPNDRIYFNQEDTYLVTLVGAGTDLTVSTASFEVIVTDDPTITANSGDLATTQSGNLGLIDFTAASGKNQVVIPYDQADQFGYYTMSQIITTLGITASDNYEPDDTMLEHYVNYQRNEFILPMSMRLIIPSLMFGVLYFMFIMMPGPMVKMYLNELYTINKFCGFLSYNMAYRSNARVLIEETLQSLETCKFAEDFAIIFFEKDRNMTDKIQDISQIYSYKFFEMYLGIVNIIFDEGVSDSTLKSLSIIQQFGDEYYNQADMFFKSKKGARSALMMIIAICVFLPCIVKSKVGSMFSLYMTIDNGYTMTIGCYLIWFGLICVIYNMYKNNKIVRAEGRYV